jgi:NADPH-dependent F420 reductase
MRIAVLGGGGNLGGALARRWARAGHEVIIGSRDPTRVQPYADSIGATAMTNADAAAAGEIVVVTVPYANQAAILDEIAPHVAGKIVVDTTVPLVPPKVMRVQLPAEGSAAMITQARLGDAARIVAAFHNVAAHKLAEDAPVACDVLVFGDDRAARASVIGLAEDAGLRGLHAGALVNSAAAEALTSVLIFLNKTYQVDGAGIQITGQLVPPTEG